jgi:hypothetical protein
MQYFYCIAAMMLSYVPLKEGRVAEPCNKGIRTMMKKIVLLGLVGLAGVITLGAAAQGISESANAAKMAECNEQADARDFGIHHYQRHRFVIRCIAGLSR